MDDLSSGSPQAGEITEVGTVTNGADGLQAFVDIHRCNAGRLLDFAYAVEYRLCKRI